MKNFVAHNPVTLHFGKGCTDTLGEVVSRYGKKVMLVLGKGSAKKYGYYDIVMRQFNAVKCEVIEFSGIKPNPLAADVDRAVKLARENSVEIIVALGGGSVIDSAKIMSLCIPEDLKAWNVMTGDAEPRSSLPLITVLTLAATGTEMNAAAVLQDHNAGEKRGLRHPLNYPKHSFLDPSFTKTVSREYTAYGIADLIAHSLEAFFGDSDVSITDRFVAEIIKDAMHWAPLVLENPGNYDYRANIMLDATFALNEITLYGRTTGDWGVHTVGHVLSLLYDVPHGASLSIIYPAWLKLQKKRIPERIAKLGELVFNTTNIDQIIQKFIKFFVFINSPVYLTDIGIDNTYKNDIVKQLSKNAASGMVHKLNNEDYHALVGFMM
ncbi:MAG: iron-containing alcohol dehydrogenase [Chlorobi bacterium]|nr:iron-containing alcohol dehydrogenase [Chlorobiota bacterium]